MANRNKKLDKLVVIDLEATCYEGGFPAGEVQEIIEIGVCLLDLQTLKVEKPQGLIVRPVQSRVSPFCTKLTTLTQEVVDKGITLKEAMTILDRDYDITRRTWASFGDFDRKLFLRDCRNKGIEFPGETRSHINIKNVLAITYGWDKELGMDQALTKFNLQLEGTHHRGVDDAKNIAKMYGVHLAASRQSQKAWQEYLNRPSVKSDEYH